MTTTPALPCTLEPLPDSDGRVAVRFPTGDRLLWTEEELAKAGIDPPARVYRVELPPLTEDAMRSYVEHIHHTTAGDALAGAIRRRLAELDKARAQEVATDA